MDGPRKYGVTPIMHIDRIKEAGKFKASVLAELAAFEKVDLKPHIRDYLDGLFEVHATARAQIAPEIPKWESSLSRPVQIFEKEYGTDHGAIWLCEEDDAGNLTRYVPIVPEVELRRRELEARTARIRVDGSFVTGEVWDG